DVSLLRHLAVRICGLHVLALVRMHLEDHEPSDPLAPLADAEVDEVLPAPRSLDEPDVVAEIVADAQQRILRVQAIVVPRDRSLARAFAGLHARRGRPRQETVDAERADEPEIRVDAGNAVAIA